VELGLEDRVVLVGGSSRGIGRAIADEFLREGARTVLTGRDSESLARTASELGNQYGEGRILPVQADLTSSRDVARVVETVMTTWGRVHTAIANVGTGRGTPGWASDPDDWTRLFEANVFGAAKLVGAVLPSMVAAKDGNVVLIGSIAGIESLPAPLPYSAAKAALANYAKNLSRQVGQFGVRVNCVAPGNVLFQGGSWDRRRSERSEEIDHYIETEVPLQRFGRVEEIAAVVVFLASTRASFVTGACVVVDGGQTRGW
jgi:3-oxoacyl-[acyl-carrier protein] reductase